MPTDMTDNPQKGCSDPISLSRTQERNKDSERGRKGRTRVGAESPVIFMANIPVDTTTSLLRQLLSKYTDPVRMIILRKKQGALIELESVEEARKMVNLPKEDAIVVNGSKTRITFSKYTSLKGYVDKEDPSAVLLVTICSSQNKTPPIPLLLQHFEQYGHVTQLVPFVHCPQNQAFVQYSSIEDAKNAKEKIQHSNLQSDGEVFYFEAQFSNYKQLDIRDHSNSYSETHQRRETTASSEVSQPITICSETPSDPTQRLVNNFGPLQPGSRDTGFLPASPAAVPQAPNYYNRSSSSSSSHSSASFLKSPNQIFQHPNHPSLPYTNRDYQTLNQVNPYGPSDSSFYSNSPYPEGLPYKVAPKVTDHFQSPYSENSSYRPLPIDTRSMDDQYMLSSINEPHLSFTPKSARSQAMMSSSQAYSMDEYKCRGGSVPRNSRIRCSSPLHNFSDGNVTPKEYSRANRESFSSMEANLFPRTAYCSPTAASKNYGLQPAYNSVSSPNKSSVFTSITPISQDQEYDLSDNGGAQLNHLVDDMQALSIPLHRRHISAESHPTTVLSSGRDGQGDTHSVMSNPISFPLTDLSQVPPQSIHDYRGSPSTYQAQNDQVSYHSTNSKPYLNVPEYASFFESPSLSSYNQGPMNGGQYWDNSSGPYVDRQRGYSYSDVPGLRSAPVSVGMEQGCGRYSALLSSPQPFRYNNYEAHHSQAPKITIDSVQEVMPSTNDRRNSIPNQFPSHLPPNGSNDESSIDYENVLSCQSAPPPKTKYSSFIQQTKYDSLSPVPIYRADTQARSKLSTPESSAQRITPVDPSDSDNPSEVVQQ